MSTRTKKQNKIEIKQTNKTQPKTSWASDNTQDSKCMCFDRITISDSFLKVNLFSNKDWLAKKQSGFFVCFILCSLY